jgi:hypothetical protein
MMRLTKKLVNNFNSVAQVLASSKTHKFNLGDFPKAL